MGDGAALEFESSVKPPQLKAARPGERQGGKKHSLAWSPSVAARADPDGREAWISPSNENQGGGEGEEAIQLEGKQKPKNPSRFLNI